MNPPGVDRRFSAPPWPVVLIQIGWLWAVGGFAFMAVLWMSTAHVAMMFVCLFLLLGVSLRWRPVFWISALACAATLGGIVAWIIVTGQAGPMRFVNLAFGVRQVVLHQTSAAFGWFAFQNSRRLRLGFWLLASIVCVAAEFSYVIFLNGQTRLRT